MDTLIATLIAWAVANSQYPAPERPPAVEFRATAYFAEEVCPRDKVHCAPRGYYEDGSGQIVLHDSQQDLGVVNARAILLHEIVHYLQDSSGQWGEKTCESWVAREHEAYRLQLLYMVSQGANPFSHAMPPGLSSHLCAER